jgi:transcriptional regulator with XRE-family HTH domain
MEDIKRLRETQGKTQKQLADEMGVERSTVAKWEAGTAFPRADKLPKLAEVLGCSVADLFNTESA